MPHRVKLQRNYSYVFTSILDTPTRIEIQIKVPVVPQQEMMKQAISRLNLSAQAYAWHFETGANPCGFSEH
ncbi:hypothetical protein [Nitrosomonas ureae]|uniref:hypothetical protein n=1 Tax=Nitrosomonas ureae TaxID=44577 RepID=UPI0011B24CDC|nr:hypothetical protein [Nitrosomonas ureae]